MNSLLATLLVVGLVCSSAHGFSVLRMARSGATDCPVDSNRVSLSTDVYPASNTLLSSYPGLLTSTASRITWCLTVDVPISSASLELWLENPSNSSCSFQVSITLDSYVADPTVANLTVEADSSAIAGPFFFAPLASTYPQPQSISETFLVVVTVTDAMEDIDYNVSLSILTAAAYWPSVVSFDFPDNWAGLVLGAPIPTPNTTTSINNTALAKSSSSADRTFAFSLTFLSAPGVDLNVYVCLSVAPPCSIATPSCNSGNLSPTPMLIAADATSFSAKLIIDSSPLLGTDCPAAGVSIRLLPTIPGAVINKLSLTPTYTATIENKSNGGLSTGDIIGIAVGAGVGVILLALLGIWIYRRSKKNDYQEF
ncbi:MAG: SKG-like transmembrane protein [archaeon]|nr:SKG-like transmembrane protein [archaeon]